mgnify:CR=1 FL=1
MRAGSPRVRRLFPNPPPNPKTESYATSKTGALPHPARCGYSGARARRTSLECLGAPLQLSRRQRALSPLLRDPNWSRLAWARHRVEEERAKFRGDPWPNGLAVNRANLERFIMYSHTQGLIDQPLPVDSLFAESMLEM